MIGQTISHYRIVARLDEGGQGVVFKAEDLTLGRTVALKFLPPDSLASEESRLRLVREARAAASLMHPGICPVYEIGEANGRAFIATGSPRPSAATSASAAEVTLMPGEVGMSKAFSTALASVWLSVERRSPSACSMIRAQFSAVPKSTIPQRASCSSVAASRSSRRCGGSSRAGRTASCAIRHTSASW